MRGSGKMKRMMTRMKKWQKPEAKHAIVIVKERPFQQD